MELSLNETSSKPLIFENLPAYAAFLLQNCTADFAKDQLQQLRKLNVPILAYFAALPEEELLKRSIEGTKKFLENIAANKASEHINASLKNWVDDQLPMISRDKIMVEDITLISHVRRKAFRNYVPRYTSDLELTIKILDEIDTFTTETDTRSFRILIKMQQELYQQAQEIARMGNWFWDLKRDKITWSNEIFRIYELPPQNEITYDLVSFNHPDDAAMIQEQMRVSRETMQPHDFYYRIILPTGVEKILHARGRVLANEKGEPYRMLGTLQDVTAQKQLEQTVKEKQALIEKIADLTPSMIAAYNIHTGQYLFINKAIQTLLGYSPGEVMEQGAAFFAPIIHPEDIGPLMTKNMAAIAEANANKENGTEPVVEFLYRIKHSNGEYRWLHTTGTIFNRNSHGEVDEVINISIDVTEQMLMTKELSQKNKELEQKNKELESFTYIASHDLQEPLRKIKFYLSQIAADSTSSDYINRTVKEATRMQQLINSLLEYSLIGPAEKSFEKTDLNTIAAEVKADLYEMLQESGTTMDIQPLPVVMGVPLQLHQLFVNLVSNAVKYRQKETASQIKIYSEFLEDTEQHKITFADNGIGFEKKYADHIFDLFRRLHNKNAFPGTGVGLAICKKIVENHNGTINAEGMPGEGAKFHIYLPASLF